MKASNAEIHHCHELEICHFVDLGQKFPSHFHDHFIIGCLLSGSRFTFCGSEHFQLKARDLLIVSPGQPHGCDNDSGPRAAWLCVHIPVKIMSNFWSAIAGETTLPVAAINYLPAAKERKSLWDMLAYAKKRQRKSLEETARNLVATLASQNVFIPSGHCAQASRQPLQAIAQIGMELRLNPAGSFSISDLAAQARMSKFSFLRRFRRDHGITPWAYLENLRVNMAMDKLRQGVSISDAALDSGFWDQSHFSRRFKAYTGFTPGSYRGAWQ